MQVIFSYLPYVLVTTFTPGPNNLMTLYVVSNLGWRRGLRVIFGIAFGFLCVMFSCAIFCHELSIYVPKLVDALKYVGAIYIAWLAIHIAASKPEDTHDGVMTFWSGFILSITNVKVILYLMTLFTAYIIPSGAGFFEILLHGIFIICVSTVSWTMWGLAGGLLQKFLAKYYRPFNIAMGIILLWCAISIFRM